MKPSSTLRYLKGRKLPGLGSPVRSVSVRGAARTVVLEDRTRITYTKGQLKQRLIQVMSVEQKARMARTLRVQPDGTAKMTIGGVENGVRKTYASEAAARRALDRRYGK